MATTEGDNDQKGDGNMYGCAVQNNLESTNTITETIDSLTGEQQAGVIVGLLALGIALAWFAYWVYRRYVPENGSARNDQQWLKRNVNRHAGITKYFNNSKQNDWLNGSSGVGGGGGGGGGGGDADDIHLQAEPLKSASQAGSGGGGRGGNSHSPVNIKMNKSARKPPPPARQSSAQLTLGFA